MLNIRLRIILYLERLDEDLKPGEVLRKLEESKNAHDREEVDRVGGT